MGPTLERPDTTSTPAAIQPRRSTRPFVRRSSLRDDRPGPCRSHRPALDRDAALPDLRRIDDRFPSISGAAQHRLRERHPIRSVRVGAYGLFREQPGHRGPGPDSLVTVAFSAAVGRATISWT